MPTHLDRSLATARTHRTLTLGKYLNPGRERSAMVHEEGQHQRSRIGELLSRIVPLSGHDVEEILQDQAGTNRKFGEIALAWGLCQPQHVWKAWCRQLASAGTEQVDLKLVGIDAQAAASIPAELA